MLLHLGPVAPATVRAFRGQWQTGPQPLATQQGMQPVTNVDVLLGGLWPEDETADAFVATVRQWRREGGYAIRCSFFPVGRRRGRTGRRSGPMAYRRAGRTCWRNTCRA